VVYATSGGVVALSTLTGFAERAGNLEERDDDDAPLSAPLAVSALVALPEGRGFVGVSSKGEAVAFDARYAIRARFVATGEESAVVTTDGGALEMLGSPKDSPIVACAIGDALVAFEVCAERLIDPGAFARALRGEPEGP